MISQRETLVRVSADCPSVGTSTGMADPTIPAPVGARNEGIGRSSIRFAGDGGAASPSLSGNAPAYRRGLTTRPSSSALFPRGITPPSWARFEHRTAETMARLRELAKVNERVLVEDD
jgi:hypothetical protein